MYSRPAELPRRSAEDADLLLGLLVVVAIGSVTALAWVPLAANTTPTSTDQSGAHHSEAFRRDSCFRA
jgi:hypothetical protein